MQQPYHLTGQGTQVDGLQQNRVLRNTYLLLALSMVPTTTSAQRLLDQVLPQIAGRIEGSAVRVPTSSWLAKVRISSAAARAGT